MTTKQALPPTTLYLLLYSSCEIEDSEELEVVDTVMAPSKEAALASMHKDNIVTEFCDHKGITAEDEGHWMIVKQDGFCSLEHRGFQISV